MLSPLIQNQCLNQMPQLTDHSYNVFFIICEHVSLC